MAPFDVFINQLEAHGSALFPPCLYLPLFFPLWSYLNTWEWWNQDEWEDNRCNRTKAANALITHPNPPPEKDSLQGCRILPAP